VACSVGTLGAGASADYTITAGVPTVTPCTTSQNIQNTASAVSDEAAALGVSTTLTATCPPPPTADLSVSMSADPGTVDQGGITAITAIFHNAGSGDAHNVSFSGSLLNERRFSRLLVFESAAGATCSEQSFAAACDLGDMASGENKEVVFTMKTVTGATCVADQLQAFTGAVVAGSPGDPQLSNNKAAAMYTVNCPNILHIASVHLTPAKTESGGYVPSALLSAQVQNVSHSAVHNTIVTVPVSESLSFLSASGGTTCSTSAGQISCNIGTLQAGETKTLGLFFGVNILTDPLCDYDTPTTIAASLSVLSDTPDPMFWDNQNYAASMTTLCPSDAAIVSADFDPKDLSEATLTVVVKNNGPGVAVRTVTMPLPSGATPLYLYNQTCGTSYGNVSCPTGWLLPGQARTFKVPFQFTGTSQCVGSSKTLTLDINDTNQSNNTSHVTVKPWNNCTVGAGTDLDLALQTPQLGANQRVTFPMAVWNISAVNASSVFVMHTLSSDETYVSASGTSCETDGDQLYCSIGDIAYHDHTSISITLQYQEPQPCGQAINRFPTFDVVTGSSETVTSNNRGTAFFELACPTDWGMVSAQFSPAAVPPATYTTLAVRVQNSGPAVDNALLKVTGTELTFYEHDMPPLCFGYPDTDTTEYGARVFTCWVGNLASGETKDLSLGFQAHGDPTNMCTSDYSPVVTTSVYGHGYDPNWTNASLRPSVMWDCPSTGALCGDGIKEGTEQCDDHNTNPGDGCSGGCQIETGWTCNNSSPSICSPVCGDGSKKGSEQCDDGNTTPGDGCTSICTTETGWICSGSNPTTCIATCGDGIKVGPEGCDDHNLNPGDGCSISCQVESGWTCNASQPSVCTQIVCGNGIVETGEGCDDYNLNPGDGCSATCTVESSWVCSGTQPSVCTKCGNGVVDTDRGEECDFAAPNEPAGVCNQSCLFAVPIPEF
jgi:cysteine-rich repeat protein